MQYFLMTVIRNPITQRVVLLLFVPLRLTLMTDLGLMPHKFQCSYLKDYTATSTSLTPTAPGKKALLKTPTNLFVSLYLKTPFCPPSPPNSWPSSSPKSTSAQENFWTSIPLNQNSCYICTTVLHLVVESTLESITYVNLR